MRFFKANVLSLTHLPTWMLMIGFPIYWMELFFRPGNYGITTPAAWIIFFVVVATSIVRAFINRPIKIDGFWPQDRIDRILVIGGSLMCLGMAAVYCYAAFLPPHLPQEEDVLNYHYTFPRQHLIRNSFDYIRWSTCDLFPLPVQTALAPFWFATELPNKIPQFLFFISVPVLLVRMLHYVGQTDPLKSFLVVFAFFGAHHVVIQGGSAMLDVVLAYLFLAALDSLLRKNWILAATEFVFYFWSKSFAPLQMTAVLIAVVMTIFVLRKYGFVLNWGFSRAAEVMQKIDLSVVRKFFIYFLFLSVIVAGPFLEKSLRVGGTPLFPFFVGVFPQFQNVQEQPWEWESFVAAAKYDLSMKDAYGLPRDPVNFIKHFWLIAVPQEGVNNVFDYPVGLVYLLCLGPFIWFMTRGLMNKQIAILPLLACVIWMSWWFGSQQSRFLYVPLFLMYLTVIAEIKITRVFLLSILFAVFLSSMSVFRAHRADFGKPVETLLRQQDKKLREISQDYVAQKRTDVMVVKYYQAAYAQFPVRVLDENIPYTLKIKAYK